MFTGYAILSILCSIVIVLLGALVLLRSSTQLLNKVFFGFSFVAAAWLIFNNLAGSATTSSDIALIVNKLALALGGFALFALYLFTIVFTNGRFTNVFKVICLLNTVTLFITALTSLVVVSVERSGDTYAMSFGPAAVYYFPIIGINSFLIILTLINARRESKGLLKRQITAIIKVLVVVLIGTVTVTALLPFFFNYFALTNAAAVFLLLLVGGFAYIMSRHKLFDLRLVVARSLAYFASIAFISLMLVISALALGNRLFGEAIHIDTLTFFTFVSFITALAFQPVKNFFDKFSNRLFFRDAYDAQDVINSVNKSLVGGGSDVDNILSVVSHIISNNIKTEYALFTIRETELTHRHVMGTKTIDYAEEDIEEAIIASRAQDIGVFTLDSTSVDAKKLASLMRKYDIEVLIRMVMDGKCIGHLLIGPKKSGNAYSVQDLNLLDIIAGEVAIAVQNALRFEEIQQFNITLQKRVEDATVKLQKSNEKLKALDEAKDEFISMASHQLRTPLTSVKGYISMVLEGDAGELNDNQRTFLDQAFVSSQRMVYLIADLLNVSRLKTGKFIIESHPTFLPDTVESELAQLKETAKSRGLKLVFDKPKKFPTLSLDETKTRQVIMNFADNAIYYTPKGGTIKAELAATKDSITFLLKDDGIGVKKEDQHHLFTKFYRAGNARKARPDGTGLGLFMAKKVIVAQGGAVIFKSEEGKGSTFGFTFPRQKLETK